MYNNQVIELFFDGRFEYDWLKEVVEKIGFKEKFIEGYEIVEEWVKVIYEEIRKNELELLLFDEFIKRGVYKYKLRDSYIVFKE